MRYLVLAILALLIAVLIAMPLIIFAFKVIGFFVLIGLGIYAYYRFNQSRRI